MFTPHPDPLPQGEREKCGPFRYALATPADDADVRRLLRENPMGDTIRISLEREPDTSLAATVEGDVHDTIVVRDRGTGALAAVGAVSVRDAYVNGRPQRLGYLGQLRLDRAYAGRASVLRGGYAFFHSLHEALGVELYLTSILADNLRARRFLERGLPGMPTYRPVETFETLLMPVARRTAATKGRPPLQDILACLARNGPRHQFAPAWTEQALLSPQRCCGLRPSDFHCATASGGDVAGCLAVWDQRAFKQVVIRGYSPWLAWSRPLINLAGPLVGVPPLPAVGQALDLGYVSHLAVDYDDPGTFAALLRTAHADAAARGLRYLALGLSSRHPLLPVAKRLFRHRLTISTLYAVHWEDGAEAAQALDGRVAHCEVALL